MIASNIALPTFAGFLLWLAMADACVASPQAGVSTGAVVRHQARTSHVDVHATGVFINADGDVLTARHAVEHCRRVYVAKDARVVAAQVRAISDTHDLAVVGTGLKPYLSATFPASLASQAHSEGVFVESYTVVQRMPNRASVVFNALSEPQTSELSLLSPVQPGASGSPVLRGGLVLGLVVERLAPAQGLAGSVALSQVGKGLDVYGPSRVKAVSTEHIKAFLRRNAIEFTESDEPQLGRMQPQAPRAATLSVGVICG